MGVMEGLTKAKLVIDVVAEHGAADIVLLDIRRLSVLADYFVICTAESRPQMRALVDHLESELGGQQVNPLRVEGKGQGEWTVVDYGDVMVHIFSRRQREYYQLERLWEAAATILRMQ